MEYTPLHSFSVVIGNAVGGQVGHRYLDAVLLILQQIANFCLKRNRIQRAGILSINLYPGTLSYITQ